jgi:hypothetical protein
MLSLHINYLIDPLAFGLKQSENVGMYRVSQNSQIPNLERGRERPSGARKILRKKKSLFLKKI